MFTCQIGRASYSIFSSYYNDLKYDSIRAAEASLKGKKTTKGELIKNFADYKIIPILNYLNETSENEDLITAFDEFAKIQNGRNGCNYRLYILMKTGSTLIKYPKKLLKKKHIKTYIQNI